MLITFEGIDGAGKTTQVKLLKDYLTEKGHEVVLLREPGGVSIAEKIRALVLESKEDINPISELLLFSASRAALIKQLVLPALEKKAVVILDRFYDSTTAYQGYGRGLDLETVRQINRIASFGLEPNLTIYLDLSPEDAMNRKFSEKSLPLALGKTGQPTLDRMESSGSEFYQRVRDGYKTLARTENHRFLEVDALLSVSEIHHKIIDSVHSRLSL